MSTSADYVTLFTGGHIYYFFRAQEFVKIQHAAFYLKYIYIYMYVLFALCFKIPVL